MTRLRILVAAGVLATAAAGYLVSNSPIGGGFVFEQVPPGRRPMDFLIDTEPVAGVGDTRAIAEELMGQWNDVAGADDPFGTATFGGPYNGGTAGQTFGRFGDGQLEVAFDDDGSILTHFGLGTGVLGITLKSVDIGSGNILDVLVVVNTQPVALSPVQIAEELLRGTLLHEFGHGVGLGHSAVGMTNDQTFGLCPATPADLPTMFPFRFPVAPEEGATLEGDDAAGLTQIYPADLSGLGSISGTVRALSGAGVNQILVRAVGPTDGALSHVGALTNEDGTEQGRFRIGNLPPGPYKVIVEPINGRGNVSGAALGANGSLGADPFVYAIDEMWQPGDAHDPAVDDPAVGVDVQVRAGKDTGSVDVVLNAEPYTPGSNVNGALAAGDAVVPDVVGGFHFADYFVFEATASQQVTFIVNAIGFEPQIRLFRPSDLAQEFQFLPAAGFSIAEGHVPAETGLYTLVLFARAATGSPGGAGTYGLQIAGASGPVPLPPAVTGADARAGANDPGARQFAAPLCRVEMLQVRVDAPSHEELWVDGITVTGSGTGDERDLSDVRLVRDLNGDGLWNGFDPVVATGAFGADNGPVVFGNLGIELDAGTTGHFLVVYDLPLPQPAGFPAWWLLPAVLALALLRRPAVVAVLLLALAPLGCGGGGGGTGCNGPFDPTGTITTFTATVVAGDIVAFTATSDPGQPLGLPAQAIVSGELSVSN